jgi:hypothetical protein
MTNNFKNILNIKTTYNILEKKTVNLEYFNKYFIRKSSKKNHFLDNHFSHISSSIKQIFLKKISKKKTGFSIVLREYLFKNKANNFNFKIFLVLPSLALNFSLLKTCKTFNVSKNNTIGSIIKSNKGGYIVYSVSGIYGFLPRSCFVKSSILPKLKNIFYRPFYTRFWFYLKIKPKSFVKRNFTFLKLT